MTLRTHTIEKKEGKKTQIWEWEETPEVVAATLLFMGGAIVTLLAVVLDVLFSSRMIVTNEGESSL